jgi:hypothetical protein
MVFHKPGVKSGMFTGALPPATGRTEVSIF